LCVDKINLKNENKKIKEKESKKEKNPKVVWLIEDNVAYASSLKRTADIIK
jgi:hypothetical protein